MSPLPPNPFPGSGRGQGGEVGLVRYPRLVAKDELCAKKLAARTLTNLYNERPTWLDLAHQKLDATVFAAYGWQHGMGDEEILEKLLKLNWRGRGGKWTDGKDTLRLVAQSDSPVCRSF